VLLLIIRESAKKPQEIQQGVTINHPGIRKETSRNSARCYYQSSGDLREVAAAISRNPQDKQLEQSNILVEVWAGERKIKPN